MNPEAEKEKENAADHLAHGIAEESPTIRPLHDCACYLISLAHSWLERITHFPFPIGTIIGCIEDTVDRWTHPVTDSLECHSLFVLAAIDDKIISLVDCCGLCSKAQLRVVLSQLCAQGLVGTTAGLWIKYEGVVKEDIRKAVCLANRVPFLNLVAPIVLSVLSPSAKAISDWLVKQGESSVKGGLQTIDDGLVLFKQKIENQGQNARSCMQAGPVIKLGVGDVQYEGQSVSGVHNNDSSGAEQRCVRMDADAVKDGLLSTKEEMDATMEGISGDDIISAEKEMKVDEVNMDKVVMEKLGRPHLAEEGDNRLPDVLEMIESSWLLGTPSFPKNPHRPPQTKHISSFGFQFKRAFFNG